MADEVNRWSSWWLSMPMSGRTETLGVITMGIKHVDRIDEALRRARQEDDELDEFLDVSMLAAREAFFVKNLERVQGDERDAIILTIGYGKTPRRARCCTASARSTRRAASAGSTWP